MQLFYTPDISPNATEFSFDKEESKHIVKVLRKTEGHIIHITDGKGNLYNSEIILALEKKCTVKITACEHVSASPFYIHMVVAPTKMNDRYEWFLEKATEIGVQEITPIICDNSERKIIKTERFDKIILAAMKQSNQLYLPKLNEPITFKQFMATNLEGDLFIAHCEERDKTLLRDAVQTHKKYTLLIGPEGDFSSKEIDAALNKGFQPVSLGHTRLRTETAAVVGCHTFVLKNE
ncbi:16S rRNA (uracil(1498)-N(3))-methyltransferase [Flavobacterium agricola]|uniref:Ribosomal RNA small subunit methyltransferase E n=1 Tax=Flavobacterium agricola TaxID=2870839 RepID=A0ABY6M0G3_9FLAO|nr:16S rRNA (uracil(1498)-N(3))-methyltransferase [Flavobacterium agricola]UYW02045.1 16S rRNA (uracil(1498)-N(3))-methyltransferase [Flavobacterium agricola]